MKTNNSGLKETVVQSSRPRIKATPVDNVGYIAPGRPISLMTGVQFAKVYASGKVTLVYEDFSEETATLNAQQIKDANDNFFSLVSAVQSYRKMNCELCHAEVSPDNYQLHMERHHDLNTQAPNTVNPSTETS